MAGIGVGKMLWTWAGARRARLAEDGRPAADARIHDSMRGSEAVWGEDAVRYILA